MRVGVGAREGASVCEGGGRGGRGEGGYPRFPHARSIFGSFILQSGQKNLIPTAGPPAIP